MNIEDVKQMSDRKLNVELSVLTGFTAKMAARLAIYGRDAEKYKNDIFYSYTANLANAREAQAKAIAKDYKRYAYNLSVVLNMHDENFGQAEWREVEGVSFIRAVAVVNMLQASPRQISMAAYITLQEVQNDA